MSSPKKSRHTLKQWIIAARPWSLPASSMPALIAITYVFYQYRVLLQEPLPGHFLPYALLSLTGAVLFQAASNTVGDYYDFKFGVDREETYGSRPLVDHIFEPASLLKFGRALIVAASLIGLYLSLHGRLHLLWIGGIGVLSAYFYYLLKYRALGDLIIFVIFGQLIALGTAYTLTNQIDPMLLIVAAPCGLLIVNILHANNTRDRIHDRQAGISTLALRMGNKNCIRFYRLLSYGAYLLTALTIVWGGLPHACWAVFLSLPLSIKNNALMKKAKFEEPHIIKDLDSRSAAVVLIFSLLFCIALFTYSLIRS